MATTTTIEQSLRCLQNAGFPAQALIELIAKEPTRLAKAEQQLKALMYPDKKLSYYMADRGVCIMQLSEAASRLMRILCATVGQTGLISYSYTGMESISGLTKKTVLNATNELIDAGIMSVVRKGKSHVKAVYCMNPAIARCGKDGGQLDAFTSSIAVEPTIVSLDSRITSSIIIEKKPPRGYDRALTYTLLNPVDAKRAADATNVNDSSKSSYNKGITDSLESSTKENGCEGQLSLDDMIKDGELPW